MAWLQLTELFPGFGVTLPPKRFFKDNYEEKFLEARRLGLQTFLQKLTSHKDVVCRCVLANNNPLLLLSPFEFDLFRFLPSEAVETFLCAADGLSLSDSLEESRVSLQPHNTSPRPKTPSADARAVDYRRGVRLWRTSIIIFE